MIQSALNRPTQKMVWFHSILTQNFVLNSHQSKKKYFRKTYPKITVFCCCCYFLFFGGGKQFNLDVSWAGVCIKKNKLVTTFLQNVSKYFTGVENDEVRTMFKFISPTIMENFLKFRYSKVLVSIILFFS